MSTKTLSPGNVYLVGYNLAQFFGWGFILCKICFLKFIEENSHASIFISISSLLYLFQTLAILEVVHAAVKLVRSNPVLTALQVWSRVFVIWGVLYILPSSAKIGPALLVAFVWSLAEIVRYLYYACGLLECIPYPLEWLRYTAFIVLYPVGVTCELLIIWQGAVEAKEGNLYSHLLPNCLNFSFCYYIYLYLTMFLYVPVFPKLYTHMLAQRKKILGKGKVA